MRVAVTGSTGLIGTALGAALTASGHQFVPVVRTEPRPGQIAWDPAAGTIDAAGLADVDAVVNLAGAGIGDKRWTPARKRLLLESRTAATQLLASTMAGLDDGPRILLNGSAIGVYGDRGDEVLDESSSPGSGFLSELVQAWEGATRPAQDAGIRTVFLRTGIVQSTRGGALAKALPLFRLGLGGRFGSGRQWWSWISMTDEVAAVLHLLSSELSGPVNLTAPEPVTNRAFTAALGRALHRPTVVPVPKFGPALLLGREAADEVLYGSQRILPRALTADGFTFAHPDIHTCFAAELAG